MAKKISRVIIASSIREKALGLIPNPNQRMLFHTRFGIHTFFMKQDIDVLVLNSSNRVVKMKQNLKPWRLFFWDIKYSRVLEIPAGEIKELQINSGDKIQMN